MTAPRTLCIDIGGTGLKAAVLEESGEVVGTNGGADVKDGIARIATTYPMPPEKLVEDLAALAAELPSFDRASAGFPGMVRSGVVLSAPHFSTKHGPGSDVDPDLKARWEGFDLAAALSQRLGCPTRVDNDADQQGAAVVSGKGLEMVITLGTGFGTALFSEGRLCPHLEIAHQPFMHGFTYHEMLGDHSRKEVGNRKWSEHVAKAVELMEALTFFDHLYVGGGNARKLKVDLGEKVTIVDNVSGIVGGLKLWTKSGI